MSNYRTNAPEEREPTPRRKVKVPRWALAVAAWLAALTVAGVLFGVADAASSCSSPLWKIVEYGAGMLGIGLSIASAVAFVGAPIFFETLKDEGATDPSVP